MNILQMSISAGLIVIAIVLIRAVALNRLPKKMFLVLWVVVLFRLLIPVAIPLPFNIPNLFNISEVSRMELLNNSTLLVIDNPINMNGTRITGTTGNITETALELFFSNAPTTAIWLVGMLALSTLLAVIYFRNHRGLRYATAIRNNDFLNEWLTENKLTRPIAIMQSDIIISPLAVGIFKPRIILPKSINMNDEQLLNYVLTHEYFHIKRYDAIWKIILLLALCVHWFNPMIWLMFVLANRDLELTCDEAVIYRFGAKTKKAYAYMLIGMAEQRGKFALLYNGFSRNATEERIESIMKMKKSSLATLLLAVVLVSALTVGALTAFASNASNDNNAGTGSMENGLIAVDVDREYSSKTTYAEYLSERLPVGGSVDNSSLTGSMAFLLPNDNENWCHINYTYGCDVLNENALLSEIYAAYDEFHQMITDTLKSPKYYHLVSTGDIETLQKEIDELLALSSSSELVSFKSFNIDSIGFDNVSRP